MLIFFIIQLKQTKINYNKILKERKKTINKILVLKYNEINYNLNQKIKKTKTL